jgi:hypothetical protein
MSENEIKDNNIENAKEKENDKTTNIINSINAIVIPNIEEISNKSTTDENYNFNKNEDLNNNNKTQMNNVNYNQINKFHNQVLPNNNNENFNHNINNVNNNVNNSNNQINVNNFNINNNLNNDENNNNNVNNNNINLYSNQNKNNLINSNNNSINQNINNNNNINQNKNQNNYNQNYQIPLNKSMNRKKSNAEKKSGQKGMKELAFKFPLRESFSKVEIPFAFQQNLDEPNNNSRFHSYITIKDTPKLYIDISDDKKMDKFKLTSTIESLKASNQEQEKKLKAIDTNIMKFNDENELLREEIEKIKKEIISRNNEVIKLKQAVQQINLNNSKYEKDMVQKINEKNNSYIELKDQYDNIKNEINNKDLNENEKKEYLSKIQEEINVIQKEYQNNFKYYTNKLINNNIYSDEYIKKSLQKDLIDFTSYVTQKIQIISPKVKELINYIQDAVDNSIGKEYEVRLYGSHATGLCLPWSDIDVVLCKKNGEGIENNSYLPLHELFTYLQKKSDFFKSINYIGTTTVPLIKIKTKENIGIQSVDISLQDKSHYGIKCVSLVLSFKEEYEVLLPMILALKNILKQANLNDPYKVSKNIILYNFLKIHL